MRPNPDGGIRKPNRSGNSTGSNPTQLATNSANNGANGPKARVITSCLTCRRRKVKCDHERPVCGACTRGNRTCRYDVAQNPGTVNIALEDAFELRDRVERLEELLIKAAVAAGTGNTISVARDIRNDGDEGRVDDDGVPTERIGRLLLEDEKAVFVGPVHWTLLTDEVKELRNILEDTKCKQHIGIRTMNEEEERQYNDEIGYEDDDDDSPGLVFGGSSGSMQQFYPPIEQCHKLFEIFMKNVEPMVKIFHRPTLKENFVQYLEVAYGGSYSPTESNNSGGDSGFYSGSTPHTEGTPGSTSDTPSAQPSGKVLKELEPLVMAMFFGATVSMKPETALENFGIEPKVLERRYKKATERALANAKFMVNPDIKVLQAFVLYLTLLFKEDDASTTWPLTGLAIRIAQSLGLHREPTLFVGLGIDVVQVEVRRRLWSHITHLDYRAAESHGQEVMISEDSFDTKLPTNIEDDELIKGQKPENNVRVMKASQESESITSMTMSLVRYNGLSVLRKLLNGTAKIRRRQRSAEVCREEEQLALDLQSSLREASSRNSRLHLSLCTDSTPLQRLIALLGRIVEWKFWVSFYNRFSKSYREKIMNMDMRRAIFGTSCMLLQCTSFAYAADSGDFNWHIDSHTQFHAIAHVLGELCSQKFQTSEDVCLRGRGWIAIEACRRLNAHKKSKAWSLVRRMIAGAEKYRDLHLQNPAANGVDSSTVNHILRIGHHLQTSRIEINSEEDAAIAQKHLRDVAQKGGQNIAFITKPDQIQLDSVGPIREPLVEDPLRNAATISERLMDTAVREPAHICELNLNGIPTGRQCMKLPSVTADLDAPVGCLTSGDPRAVPTDIPLGCPTSSNTVQLVTDIPPGCPASMASSQPPTDISLGCASPGNLNELTPEISLGCSLPGDPVNPICPTLASSTHLSTPSMIPEPQPTPTPHQYPNILPPPQLSHSIFPTSEPHPAHQPSFHLQPEFPTFTPPVADEFIIYNPPDPSTTTQNSNSSYDAQMDWNNGGSGSGYDENVEPIPGMEDFDLNMLDFDMGNWDLTSGGYMMFGEGGFGG